MQESPHFQLGGAVAGPLSAAGAWTIIISSHVGVP
jgi:hypothetical protein